MTLDQYLSRVAPHVPYCPIPTIERAIYDAAQEFCEKTRVVSDAFAIDVLPGVSSYEIEHDSNGVIMDFSNVFLDGQRLDAAAPGTGDVDVTAWYRLTDGAIEILRTPDKSGLLTGEAILTSRLSGSFPAKLDRWREAVVSLTLSRLCAMRGTNWYDPDTAGFNRKMAEMEINRACGYATLSTGRRTLRATPCN